METPCTVCGGPVRFSSSLPLPPIFPCSHVHCLPCLRLNYTLSSQPQNNHHQKHLSDSHAQYPPPLPTTFRPVQCCPAQRMPIPRLRAHLRLTSAETAVYRARLAEYDTPPGSRLYCSAPACGRFIPPALQDSRVGKCRRCWTRTCVRCGEQAHAGSLVGECAGVVSAKTGGLGGIEKAAMKPWKEETEGEEGFRRIAKKLGW
ncbi:uncharacterized protein C8A04DRAFT_13478 [Dichotomopilus funicola]|uniref:IBR domain-containing protein n=1 Tax=Dichotomopilus funicola TaxID=1934379 RepID=A0AAN6UZJ3_9PEZI|nr:hypothetical protein C8A04DRAFT_13478 [Dichotomopilus funicola]